MADETEEIVSESRKIPKKPYKGLTPGQAGLFATIASAPAGPLAPVIGLGTALFAKIRRDNYNDEQARYLDNLAEENAGLQKVLDREDEIADPNEKRRLLIAQQLRTDGYMRLAAGDASGDQLVKQAYNIAQNIVETDTQFDN